MCRKTQILSTPDRTCHQVPRSVEFFAIKLLAPWSLLIRLSFAVLTTLCRHPIHWFSDFGEVVTCRKYTTYKIMLKFYAQQKNAPASYTITSSKRTPPRSNARRPPRNEWSRRRLEYAPGLNTRVCLGLVSMTFLQQGWASWLKFVRLVILGLMTEGPRKGRWGEAGLHRCTGCVGG